MFILLYLREYAAEIACLLPEAILPQEHKEAPVSLTPVQFSHIFATNDPV